MLVGKHLEDRPKCSRWWEWDAHFHYRARVDARNTKPRVIASIVDGHSEAIGRDPEHAYSFRREEDALARMAFAPSGPLALPLSGARFGEIVVSSSRVAGDCVRWWPRWRVVEIGNSVRDHATATLDL